MTRNWTTKEGAASPGRRRARWKMVLGGLGMVALCVLTRYYWGADSAQAQSPTRARPATVPTRSDLEATRGTSGTGYSGNRAPAARSQVRAASAQVPAESAQSKIVAMINGQEITREELARECLRHYGNDVLDSLIYKQLIVGECQRRQVSVTQEEVDAEIERMAKRFGLPVEQWLKMLKQERGIGANQYASDIIWPTLALRKLAGDQIKVAEEELVQAFEQQYGPSVRARLIACREQRKAEKLRAQAAANPEQFGNLAKEYSEDVPSAAAKGIIQPIRRHGNYPDVERAAFGMADGEISPVIKAGGQYVIIKREGLLPARDVKLQEVAPQLEELIRERKLKGIAAELFRHLKDQSSVEKVLTDPVKRQQMPGVAAVINGRQFTVSDLAEQCIQRHGQDVLEGTINRRLIEQACKKHGVSVSDKEMNEEIARAAAVGVRAKPDGTPDIEAWIKLVTERQRITEEIYRRDAVWPSVALRKLVGNNVQVSDEDLRKGYEANFGARVRCRAIVLSNLKRAQQVWEMARNNLNVDYFGDLAAQYSVEVTSRELRGEVPPIQKHGGQPLLEKEAFALKPGELSGIIQTGDKYVILFCEGTTKPADVSFATVRNDIYQDIYEKKLRLAMGEYFEALQSGATVDNYLSGTSRSPKRANAAMVPSHIPTLRQVPARQ